VRGAIDYGDPQSTASECKSAQTTCQAGTYDCYVNVHVRFLQYWLEGGKVVCPLLGVVMADYTAVFVGMVFGMAALQDTIVKLIQ
jgi:hypothetical protein